MDRFVEWYAGFVEDNGIKYAHEMAQNNYMNVLNSEQSNLGFIRLRNNIIYKC